MKKSEKILQFKDEYLTRELSSAEIAFKIGCDKTYVTYTFRKNRVKKITYVEKILSYSDKYSEGFMTANEIASACGCGINNVLSAFYNAGVKKEVLKRDKIINRLRSISMNFVKAFDANSIRSLSSLCDCSTGYAGKIKGKYNRGEL